MIRFFVLVGFTIGLLALTMTQAMAASTNCEKYNTGIFRGVYEGKYDKTPCTISELNQVFIAAGNVLSIMLGLVGGLFTIFMIKGGLSYITSQGDSDQVNEAKGTMTNAIVGLVIVLVAFGVVRLLVTGIGGTIQ